MNHECELSGFDSPSMSQSTVLDLLNPLYFYKVIARTDSC